MRVSLACMLIRTIHASQLPFIQLVPMKEPWLALLAILIPWRLCRFIICGCRSGLLIRDIWICINKIGLVWSLSLIEAGQILDLK